MQKEKENEINKDEEKQIERKGSEKRERENEKTQKKIVNKEREGGGGEQYTQATQVSAMRKNIDRNSIN